MRKKKLFLPLPIIIAIAAVVLGGVGIVGALNGWFGGGGSIPEDTMTRGLVGYWPMDEGTGQIAYDASGNSNNGTLTYMVTSTNAWTKGKVGGALSFDGTDDYVSVPDSSVFDTQNVTVSTWINPNAVSGFANQFKHIVTKRNGSGDADWFLSLDDATKGAGGAIWILYFTDTSALQNDAPVNSFVAGQWQHIAGTWDGTNLKLYRNGILLDNDSASGKTLKTNSQLRIGWSVAQEGTERVFNGLIDEVRIYNRALSADEIRYHYNRGAPVVQWKFDEGEGRTAYDSTNNNNGTLVLAGSATSSAWVAGKYGSALNFDGTDDYVKSVSNVTGVSQFSHSLWFKSADGAYSADEYLLSQGTNDPSVYLESTDNKVKVMADNALKLSSNTTVNDTKWHHTEVTADGATLKLYLDGILESQTSYTGSSATGLLYAASSATPGSYFSGLIDDVRVYNYARAPDEVKLDYNAGFAAKFGPQSSCGDDPGACMTQGLVGYWGFEEGSGATAHDSSNYANTGALTSGPSWTTGKVGSALSFDGVNDYVDPVSDISLTGSFTISSWVYIHSAPAANGQAKTIFCRTQLIPSRHNYYQDIYNDAGTIKWRLGFYDTTGATWRSSMTTTNYSLNTWHHFLTVWDTSDDTIYFYIDGIKVTGSTFANAAPSDAGTTSIGANVAENAYYFDGLIDEVRIYNRALSAEEVRYHYNRGAPVVQWKFDEGEGRTVYDSTDTNNDGTLVLAGSATSSAWVAGKYGSALSFDGVNDYVKSGSNVTGVSQFSHSLWFKSLDGAYSADEYLLSQGTNDPSVYLESTDNKVKVMADNALKLSSNTTVNDTKWHHAQITADGTIIKLYLDGILESQTSYTGSSATGLLYAGSSATPASYFSGIIDDVRVYNYARAPDEVKLDYNAGFAAYFGPKSDCNTDPGACMTQGLVGYWGFEEGSGATAHDSSNYANTGALTGGPLWTTGKVGSALSFDGVNDYMGVADSSSLRISSAIAMVTWVNWTDDGYNLDDVLIDKTASGDAANYRFFIVQGGNESNPKKFGFWNGTSAVYSNTQVGTGWHRLAVTISGTSLTFYYDGAAAGTASIGLGSTNSGSLLIGTDSYGILTRTFHGLIDEVRIYNRALTAEEIRFHYNRGAPVAHWPFDEGSGSVLYDKTESNNDGHLYLAPSGNTATSSTWVAGKYGSALNFDGTDDYVKSVSNVAGVSQFSHSLWFKSVDGAYSADEYLLSQGTNDPSVYLESTDSKVKVMADNALKLSSNTTVNDTKWHHTEVTADGTTLKLYLDGVLESQISYTGSSATGLLYAASSVTPASYFSGFIDDVRVYNYARTPAQIQQDYNAGLGAHFK